MLSRVRDKNLFAKLFSFGLLLLFADVFKQTSPGVLKFGFFDFNALPFFAAGVTVCLVSLLFLLTEWVMLPYGTHLKRIKLYQGAGNLFAFTILAFGCLSEYSTQQNLFNQSSLALSSGGLAVAAVFAWAGKPIADFCSRKRIKTDVFAARNPLDFAETVR